MREGGYAGRVKRIVDFIISEITKSRNMVAITTSSGFPIVIWHNRERFALLEEWPLDVGNRRMRYSVDKQVADSQG